MSDTATARSELNSDSVKDENRHAGVAYILPQYIVPISKEKDEVKVTESQEADNTVISSQYVNNNNNAFPNKKKRTGANHNRPTLIRDTPDKKLCRSYWNVLPGEIPEKDKCPFEKCVFSHDLISYLEKRPPDISEECHNFITFGFCPYGVTCRFGSKHIKDGGSVVDEERKKLYETNPPVRHALSKELQKSLRKRTYDFSKAAQAIKEAQRLIKSSKEGENDPKASSCPILKKTSNVIGGVVEDTAKENSSEEKLQRVGPASDEDKVPLRQSEKKKIDWNDKLYLAPLTTLGNLPFRRVCKRLGADITCSEMALASCLLLGNAREWALVKRHSSEDIFGVQLCGSHEEVMTRCAQLLEQEIDMDFVDINMGCPIDLIFKQGSGSALMNRHRALGRMVQGMSSVLSCPLTLKMRTAAYKKTQIAHNIIEKAKLWDVSLFTVHGRTREERYLRSADWEYINKCASVADPIPLFGNGDVFTYDDYVQRRSQSNVAGIMLGRGPLIKPWIFSEIKEKRQWDISSSERLDIIKEFSNYGLEHWGSDKEGVEKTRRFLLEWLSFLCRYIPVGILEQPQQMNQRPPRYIGRNDLETLMASNSAKDWVKISEMLLGPTPSDFAFMPKHNANAWS